MKKIAVLIVVVTSIMGLTSFSFAAQNAKKQAVSEKSIPIKVNYMEAGKIIPNTTIYLLYYDSVNSKLIEKNANTKAGKTVSFDVPLDKDGASYPFVVLYDKGEADKARQMVKNTTIMAFRTPAGENCQFLELTKTKGAGTKNEGCSIQMWSMGKN